MVAAGALLVIDPEDICAHFHTMQFFLPITGVNPSSSGPSFDPAAVSSVFPLQNFPAALLYR